MCYNTLSWANSILRAQVFEWIDKKDIRGEMKWLMKKH